MTSSNEDNKSALTTPPREVVRDLVSIRKEAIRYWEKRRLWHNLLLVIPTLLGYAPAILSGAVGDPKFLGTKGLAAVFLISILGANVLYSFAYVLEFFFESEDPNSNWRKFGRRWCFVAGTFFAMILAFGGGRNIFLLEVYGPPIFSRVESRQYMVPPDFQLQE
jgi:hypothetical protein